MTTWGLGETGPEHHPAGAGGVLLGLLRIPALIVVNFVPLLLLLALRLVERPLFGLSRPVTPWITQAVCRVSLWIMGISYRRTGTPLTLGGAMVANHSSWLDIYALNSGARLYFVSKAEVAGWPGIGWLARATGTVFIHRDRRQAAPQVADLQARLKAGHRLLFFPEGTSTDGRRILPFKTTLFGAFYGGDPDLLVQPVTVIYEAPEGDDPRLYGWWGDMEFGSHLWTTLSRMRQGRVTVVYGTPIPVREVADRKALAARSEQAVRSAHPDG